jgi:hypothetical protein
MSPLQFINALNRLPFSSDRCNSGYCYQFARLLLRLYPDGGLEWDKINHVAYRWNKNGVLYDAAGIMTAFPEEDFEPMTEADKTRASRWAK